MTHLEAERRDNLQDHYISRVKQLDEWATLATGLLLDWCDAHDLTDPAERLAAYDTAAQATRKFILTAGA